MSQKKFRTILIIPMVILFLIGVILNAAALMMKSTLDQFLGTDEKTVVGASNLSGLYYEQKYTDGEAAKAAGYVIAEHVNAEGSILLKNNSVLPLASDAVVVPFGYAFRNPAYGQSSASGSA